jgi:L,D-peptidoglycan transpeptidase YkuD (ErfK/YbiS/YcfS/YnhG family)
VRPRTILAVAAAAALLTSIAVTSPSRAAPSQAAPNQAAPSQAAPSQAPPARVTKPDARTATPEQVITVRVDSRRSTVGTLEAWKRRTDGSFRRVLGPVTAYVGTEGVGKASEYRSRTPRGVFTVTEAFGRSRNPGARLPYRRLGPYDWWVSDVNSPAYNTMQTCAPGTCKFSTSSSEHVSTISLYNYALVIDYNRNPVVPGAGSAFFLHISAGEPTQGCVSVSRSTMRKLLRWLKPSQDPVISIGVGDKAYAPLS